MHKLRLTIALWLTIAATGAWAQEKPEVTVDNVDSVTVEDQTVENFETLKHPKYEVYTDKAGEFRFRLKAKNGEIIATSEGYKKKASALNGIASIGKNAPDAKVEMLDAE